jgi:Mlc titration factor MtfA (ptsG expression regulator)
MLEVLVFLLVALSIGISVFIKKIIVEQKRAKLKICLFPKKWESYLNSEVYLYRKLPPHLQQELHEHIKIFLAEKKFTGQDGLFIDEQIKLKIASQACILLLGDKFKQRNYFPYLKYIYVYPDNIQAKKNHYPQATFLLGQSSVGNKSGHDGIISLSWSQICRESLSPNLGENVVLHEFAHQLDQEFGSATGMPRLPSLEDSLEWGKVFAYEYEKHTHAVMNNQATIIDIYGATHRVEFFAVVTEAFFLKARLLATYHPLLYNQLKKYYGVDPVNWN